MDWTVSLGNILPQLPPQIGIQGNLDPLLLESTPDTVALAARRILGQVAARPGHIFNLGHGVPPAAKLECIESLIQTVRHNA